MKSKLAFFFSSVQEKNTALIQATDQTYRITEEDVTALNIGHLPLNPVREGGYAGVLGVFHNLHCLVSNRLQHAPPRRRDRRYSRCPASLQTSDFQRRLPDRERAKRRRFPRTHE